jgi:hypothetical protein
MDRLAAGDSRVWRSYRWNVATAIAGYLAALDRDIKAVYFYDPRTPSGIAGPGGGATDPVIHLIVHARRRTAALLALVGALDQALARHASQRLALHAMHQALDVQLITDDDAGRQVGYAALFPGLQQLPVPIWQENEENPRSPGP